eukprot:3081815-Pleurochrysis_carterae.AAC.1
MRERTRAGVCACVRAIHSVCILARLRCQVHSVFDSVSACVETNFPPAYLRRSNFSTARRSPFHKSRSRALRPKCTRRRPRLVRRTCSKPTYPLPTYQPSQHCSRCSLTVLPFRWTTYYLRACTPAKAYSLCS